MLKVHVDKRGNLTSVNGALVPVRNLDMARTLGPRAAAAKAVAAVRAQPPTADASVKGIRAASSQLVVYRHGLIQGVDKGRTELAYQVEVTNKKNIRDMVFVTADDGKVVNRYSLGPRRAATGSCRGRAQAERRHLVQQGVGGGRQPTTS